MLPYSETYREDLKPATYYQVDLTGTAEKIRLSGIPDEDTHYQVELTLSGRTDSIRYT
jgi:hypothetical protein